MKKLASVRTAETILPDVTKSAPQPPQGAVVGYRLGDKDQPLRTWQGEEGVHPFTRIDVFDSRGVLIHVDSDLAYVYTPSDLALFRLVHEGIDGVKALLDKERMERVPRGNPFLGKFDRDWEHRPKIETLGASTNLKELEQLAEVPEEEEAGGDALREQVEALGGKNADTRLELATSERTLYGEVQDALGVLEKFDTDSYAKALAGVKRARDLHLEASQAALASEAIPGVLRETWRAFIEAGDAYLSEIADANYPEQGDSCAYCRQPLGEAAVELVRKYRDYCNSDFKEAVNKAERLLNETTAEVLGLDVDGLRKRLERKKEALPGEKPPEVLRASETFMLSAATLQECVKKGEGIDGESPRTGDCRRMVDSRCSEADALIKSLSSEVADRKRRLETEKKKLKSLEGRLMLREHLPNIREHVAAAKWVDRAAAHGARFRSLTRSLTETSKMASAQVLNPDFAKSFEAECGALHAPSVTLDFPGREGEAKRRKSLTPDHKLSEILSEGEQKVIALADFIAEASLRRSSSPLLFDDPVTSMDYRRLRYVARRLVELSESRQVIVFTHNIWFTMELLQYFEKNKGECTYYEVSDDGSACGLVSKGNSPRLDSWVTRRADSTRSSSARSPRRTKSLRRPS